jgi:hypothetical protein
MTQPVESQIPEEPAPTGALALAAFEASIAALVVSMYAAWLGAVAAAVLAAFTRFGAPPDPTAIWSTVPIWERQVDRLISGLEQIARAGWIEAGRQLGVDIPFDPTDSILQDQLARTRNLMIRTPDEVYRRIIDELGAAVANGESVDQQAARVRHVLDVTGTENWPARARTVSVTECLPGGMGVDGADISAAYRRWYEGDMVSVWTKQGNEFRGTPNHPVLTVRGWVGLGSLLEGDRLVCDCLKVDGASMSLNPDVKTVPSTVAEVFDAVKAVGVIGRIAGGEPDFHGDGSQGDVDVLAADGLLLHGIFTPLDQARIDLSLEPSAFAHALLAAQSAPFSYLGSLQQISGFTEFDAEPAKNPADGASVAAQLGSQILGAATEGVLLAYVAAGDAARHRSSVGRASNIGARGVRLFQNCVYGIDGNVEPAGDDRHRDTSAVFLDDVVSVRTSKFSGHVYNLSTAQGYFVSNGVFTGNTHRAYNMGGLATALRIQQRESGPRMLKRWDAKDDSAVRPAHRLADGQVQYASQPFMVGGEPLMSPGDPSGSPWNVINCRCKQRFSRGTR